MEKPENCVRGGGDGGEWDDGNEAAVRSANEGGEGREGEGWGKERGRSRSGYLRERMRLDTGRTQAAKRRT